MIDLAHGSTLAEGGFDDGIHIGGGTRAEVSYSYSHKNYRFYLAGRCYSWKSQEHFQDWLRRFQPAAAGAWARELDGDVAIFVLDVELRQIYLVSDRNGPAHSYYSHRGDCLFISSSRYELIRRMGSAQISSYAAYQLLTLGYIIDPESLLQNVRVTMPGQIIKIDSTGRHSSHQYFSPVQLDCNYFATEIECVTALDTAYRDIFQKRYTADRLPCVMLSGGIDSLTLMKYAKELYEGDLLSLTYSFKGLYPNELEPARIAARHFGSKHHEVVIEPEDAAALFVQNLQTNAVDGVYLTSFAIRSHLANCGGSFDLFTGQDSRLHTPPFDNPRELGIYLNRAPESKHLVRLMASQLARLLSHWPIEGPLKRYLHYWAKNLTPRSDLRSYVLETLTPFNIANLSGSSREFYRSTAAEMPDFGRDDSLQQIFKKYVALEYRTQYTDDMNCLVSTLKSPVSDVHCPFYDWQAIEASNRIPYHLGMRGDFTFKTWNKMPYVRKRIARLLVQDVVPDTLLYRAKKTCPHLDLIFNSSMAPAVKRILQAWLPSLLANVDSEVRDVIQSQVQAFSSKSRFVIYDDLLLRKIQSICYLATLQQVCQNPAIHLDEELAALIGSSHAAGSPRFRTAAM